MTIDFSKFAKKFCITTPTTYGNMAGVYFKQGDYPKSLEWYQKALAIFEKVLGKEHPHTAITYNNIMTIEAMLD